MKYLLAILVLLVGSNPSHPRTKAGQRFCAYVEQSTHERWDCPRLVRWVEDRTSEGTARGDTTGGDTSSSFAMAADDSTASDATTADGSTEEASDTGSDGISNGF